MVLKRIFNLSNLTLLTALALSGIAAWYSILGLTAIFAAAVIPIIVMGGSLEVAKVVTTVWLHKYWDKISWQMKVYLVPAVVALAFLTSMGIFGFLSKAHMDQGVPTGDVAAKVALLDEKIKTQKDNIEVSRKALAQMDAQVEQRLSRSETETGVDKAVTIRKQQAKERTSLQNDIAAAQKEIAKLNEERAPIASELRKVEAEVGPIKYIAALIYGDDPDQNVLERAVRWVIILIVFVFDPLALTLVIASNTSRRWEVYEELVEEKLTYEEPEEDQNTPDPYIADVGEKPTEEEKQPEPEEVIKPEPSLAELHPYLFKPPGNPHPPGVEICPPMVAKEEVIEDDSVIAHADLSGENNEQPEDEPEELTSIIAAATNPGTEPESEQAEETQEANVSEEKQVTVDSDEPVTQIENEIIVSGNETMRDLGNGYVSYEGKSLSKEALKGIKPEYFVLTPDSADQIGTGFGNSFPIVAKKGDTYVRVDVFPNKVFKFDGYKWIEVNKSTSDSYLSNDDYLGFIVSKIESGEYDLDLLTDIERERIAEYLSKPPETV